MRQKTIQVSEYVYATPNVPVTQVSTHYTRIFSHDSSGYRRVIADVFGLDESDAKNTANIFSASYDLLSALEETLKVLHQLEDADSIEVVNLCHKIVPAIKKAKGE